LPIRKSPLRTPALLAANRANALKSTGPRTGRGKARSRLNALRTGQYVRDLRGHLETLGDTDALFLLDWIYAHLLRRFVNRTRRHLDLNRRQASRVWCRLTGQQQQTELRRQSLPAGRAPSGSTGWGATAGLATERSGSPEDSAARGGDAIPGPAVPARCGTAPAPAPPPSKSFWLRPFGPRIRFENHRGAGVVLWYPYRSPYASRPAGAPLVPAFADYYGDGRVTPGYRWPRAAAGRPPACGGSVTGPYPGTKPECPLESEKSIEGRSMTGLAPGPGAEHGFELATETPGEIWEDPFQVLEDGLDNEGVPAVDEVIGHLRLDRLPGRQEVLLAGEDEDGFWEQVAERAVADEVYLGELLQAAKARGPEAARALVERLARSCDAIWQGGEGSLSGSAAVQFTSTENGVSRDGGQGPGAAIAQELGDQGVVQGVTGPVSHHLPDQRIAQHHQISDEIQNLVAAKLVGKTDPFRIHDALAGEDHGILQRTAAHQAVLAQHLDLFREAESAGRGDLGGVIRGAASDVPVRKDEVKPLLADERMRKDDAVRDLKNVTRIHGDALGPVDDFHRLQDAGVAALGALPAQAGLADHAHERGGAAVHDGDLEVVDLHPDVVHAGGGQRREQVLGGGDQHTPLHQAGGVTHPGHVASESFDLEPVEVGAVEDDAVMGRGRHEPDRHRDAGMKSNAGDTYG